MTMTEQGYRAATLNVIDVLPQDPHAAMTVLTMALAAILGTSDLIEADVHTHLSRALAMCRPDPAPAPTVAGH